MKKILVLLLASLVCFSAVSCGEKSSSNGNNADSSGSYTVSDENKTEKNIDAVAKKLGLTGGSDTLFSMIGATDGKEYNDGDVELYQFDEKSEAYKNIISGNGYLKATAYKDGIVLIVPASAQADPELIEAFNALEFK